MITQRRGITAKIEASQGVDANPTPALDAIRVETPAKAWFNNRETQPESVRPSQGSEQSIYGGSLKQLTFEALLKGSGTAGTPPEVAPLLRACSLAETIIPATSVSYTPVSEEHETATLYFYEDGRLGKMTGAMGNLVITGTAGLALRGAFTFTGHWTNPVDTPLPSFTFSSVKAPAYINAPFVFGGAGGTISTFSVDLGNVVTIPENVTTLDGYGDAYQVNRGVSGSFNPLDSLPGQRDWPGVWQSDTLNAMTSGAFGAAGNRIEVKCDFAQLGSISDADRDGVMGLELGFRGRISAGDDDFELIFT